MQAEETDTAVRRKQGSFTIALTSECRYSILIFHLIAIQMIQFVTVAIRKKLKIIMGSLECSFFCL
jgi:hypothetical protein